MASAAAFIKASRKRAGLTQAEVARRAGMTQPVVARLEREGANPRLNTLERVIAATGGSLELSAGPASVIDETMIVADLKLSPDERLRRFEELYDFARRFGGVALRADGS
jgi:transcriptional regulator with XRE-family HTH domain